MAKTSLYNTLRHTLPKNYLSLFLRAAVREPILLRTLENSEFLENALVQLGKNPLLWTPTHLALIKLGITISPEELRASPAIPLAAEIRQSAVQTYDTFRHDPAFLLSDLADAGLVALAMRERARILGSWEGLWKELPEKDPHGIRLALVCAYGLNPEPEPFLKSILQESKNLLLCARIIYAQPIEAEKQARMIARLSLSVRASDRLSLLRHLEVSCPDDVRLLASELRRAESANPYDKIISDHLSGTGSADIWQLPKSIYFSEIYKNTGDSETSFEFFEVLLNQFAILHEELLAEYLIEAVRNQRLEIIDQYISGAEQIAGLSAPTLARLSLSLFKSGETNRALSILPETVGHPAILLMRAILKVHHQLDGEAHQIAAIAAANEHFLTETDYELLKLSAELFLRFEQPYQAARITRYLVEQLPDDPEMLILMAQTEAITGSKNEAVEYAHLAVALAPENREIHRQLIQCLEINDEWSQALNEWEALLGWTAQPAGHTQSRASVLEADRRDVRAVAITAAKSGNFETALQLCWQLLEKDADDGLTHLTLGNIYSLSGENELALEHKLRANHLAPDQVETWLQLADAYHQSENTQQALNVLRTAVQALPENSDLHLATGAIYDAIGQPTQALAACRKAADLAGMVYDPEKTGKAHEEKTRAENYYLNPRKGKIAILLGRLLADLGHPDQAVTILHQAYQTREYREIVAYDYARALLRVQKDHQALSALSLAYQHNRDNDALALEYARLLMKLGEQPEIAAEVLQKILQAGSYNPEVLGLLAEALAASSNFKASLVYYQKAMETNLMADTSWAPRLSIGLSHVAIKTGSPNLAVAALQEAIQKAPHHLALRQKLSEACAAASLEEDAVLAAEQSLEIAPADVENLLWYARQTLTLHAPELAQRALENAAELSPNNPGLLIQLAQTQQLVGKAEKARANYQKAAMLPEITLEQLYLSARGLLDLHDPEGAIKSLEKVQLLASSSLSGVNQSIILLLARAYEEVGQYETALEMLEHSLIQDKDSVELLKQKARIHMQLNQTNAASACLSQVLILKPADAGAYQMLVEIYEARGELHLAHENARLFFELSDPGNKAVAAATAAQLSWKLFQENEAEQFLNSIDFQTSLDPNDDHLHKMASLRGLMLTSWQNRAELDELVNTPAISKLDNGRIRALLAANSILNMELEEGEALLQQALDHIKSGGDSDNLSCELIFESACMLADFQTAIEVVNLWQQFDPDNPRAHLAKARALTERAELKQFLIDVGARRHGPADDAVSLNALKVARTNLSRVLEQLGFQTQAHYPTVVTHPMIPGKILRWIIRCEAVISRLEGQSNEPGGELAHDLARLETSPDNTAALVALLRSAGMIEQSVQAAKDYPSHASVLAQLALSSIKLNPIDAMAAALSALEAAISSRQVQILPAYQALIAMSASQAEKYSQAYQAISIALTEWPDEERWHELAASLSKQLGDFTGSIQHLEKAVSLDLENPGFRQELADIYRATGALSRAADALAAVCSLVPNEPENWIHLAEVLIEQGEMAAAAGKVSQALSLDPENPEYLQFAAELALANREYQQTCELSGKLLELDPANATAAYLLAKSLSALNKKLEAIEVLDQAQKFANRPVELYLERIRLVRSLQGIQPAYQSLVALRQQHPEHPGVLALLAEYLQEQGQTQEALNTAQKALQMAEPTLSAAEKSKLHALMGRILRRTGQLDQAIHQLSQAVSLNTQKIELYLELGKAHQERRQIQEALAVYQKAINIAPEDPRPYQQAGMALKECKDYLGAEKMIRRAAELSPHDISIHRLLGSLVALNLVHNAQ